MRLSRQLEPEVMDDSDEALIYDAMDHSGANDAFISDLMQLDLAGCQNWLDLGTGTGQMALELCRRCKMPQVTAIDLSDSMLDLARCHVEAAGLADRIRLDKVDAKQLPWPDEQFDVVMSNSIVHHIPHPESVLQEAVRVTREHGILFFRDLLRPDSKSHVEQMVTDYMLAESERAQQLFRDSLHAALTLDEVRALIERIGFSPDSVYASSDRHWTWSARKR